VNGYSDGLYHPNDTLTRAQFSKLAVLAENHGDQLSQSAYRSLFSDVGSNYWAHSYVNLAYTEGLVNGYGNGTFGPNDPVTVAQAVTIILRMLGYTSDDVGPFWPEDYMAKASDLGLLDGISKSSGESLTRGEAALLFCAMLNSDTSAGGEYLDSYASSVVKDAVVVDNDAEADDGTLGTALVYAGGGLTYYEQSLTVASGLVGTARGTLLLDKSGKVIGFVPDDDKTVTITVSEAAADELTSSAGKSYDISGTAAAILEDNDTTYSTAWYDLVAGDQVTLFYASAGDVVLVVRCSTEKYDGTMLTGLYESASPSTSNPSSISILGISLDTTTSAAKTLKASFSVGDRITVVLNASGEIASVYSATSKSTVNIGVLGSGKVTLACGLVATGDIDTDAEIGTLVSVSNTNLGKLAASSVSSSTADKLYISSEKLGSASLAENVTIYEHVGNAPASKIDLSDILTATVSADKIDYYHTNSSGKVDILLLDDVTGNQYTYGMLKVGSVSGGDVDESTDYTLTTVAVENSDGTTDTCTTVKDLTDVPGGIAIMNDGELAGIATLSKVTGIGHSDFDGSDSVTVSGYTVPIATDVQVYNDVTNTWVSLEEALAFSDSFTVYYDRTLTTGAQVRVIIAK